MKALIIEDEPLVCNYLVSLIAQLSPAVTIVATLDTVASATAWFRSNPHPDIVFLDIHLADGLSFDIFDTVRVTSPIVFTTAYDQYAIRAFKLNSIDYLLKPITLPALEIAYKKLQNSTQTNTQFVNTNLLPTIKNDFKTGYKTRFVVKVGEHLRMIPIEQVSHFFSHEKSTWLCTTDHRQYPLDLFLDAVAESLDPAVFFRINRKYLVAIHSITDISVHSGSRLLVKLPNTSPDDTVVSRERVADFKLWIEG